MLKGIPRALLICTVMLASPLAAQQLRGVVRDSVSGQPVPGAVVMVVDSAGNTLSRNITSVRGQYRVPVAAEARHLRFFRIGFQPRTVGISAAQLAGGTFDVALLTTPTLLSGLKVTATPGCSKRPDRAEAFALLDQARAGLLAMIVAREANPAQVVRIRFDRTMQINGEGIESQSVRIGPAMEATVSFFPERSASDLLKLGFRTSGDGPATYFGPDADVLLSESFALGYCFHIARPEAARTHQVGLAFTPAKRQRGRVDIDGAIWIDTATRTLHDIDFHYLGLDRISEGLRAGGQIHFQNMPSGTTFIDRWALRLVSIAEADSSNTHYAIPHYTVHEIGGELANASWPDGQTWNAPLGTVQISAVNAAGKPAPGIAIGLENTNYRAITDSSGHARIPMLVPGPYSATVIEPQLATIGIALPTELSFVAERSVSLLAKLEVPTAEAYVTKSCLGDGGITGTAWVIGRVTLSDDRPVTAADVSISVQLNSGLQAVHQTRTDNSGLFHYCEKKLTPGNDIEVKTWRNGQKNAGTAVRQRAEKITVVRLQLPAVIAARPRDGARKIPGPLAITGIVIDSITGAPLAEARVSLLGTLSEAVTGADGRFVLGGVPHGVYTVEVSTPELDSIGAVKRTPVNFGDGSTFLQLHIPPITQITSSLCGAANATGMLVGRITPLDDRPLPPGMRVVAEWLELHTLNAVGANNSATSTAYATMSPTTAAHVQWLTTRVDTRGTYRLCGVPTGVPLTLRSEADSGLSAAAPISVRVAGDRRFARADLAMTRDINQSAVFTGFVTGDSIAGVPIVDAEVQLVDLTRSAFTNDRGGFRFNDVTVGTHRVAIRHVGFSPLAAQVSFAANQTVQHRIALNRAQSLAAVAVVASAAPAEFEEHRKLGLGRFLTREQIAKSEGRQMQDLLGQVSGLLVASARDGHAYIVGRRAPSRISTGSLVCDSISDPKVNRRSGCNAEFFKQEGLYCPTSSEALSGITCACYSQVYVDGRLMNASQPTEPFDVNSIALAQTEGIEWYASAAQTPGRYSALNARCGVMLVWTRRNP